MKNRQAKKEVNKKSKTIWIVLLIGILVLAMVLLFKPEFLQIKTDTVYTEEYNLKTFINKNSASEEMLEKVLVNPDFCEKKGYTIDKQISSESLKEDSLKPFVMHEYKFLGRYHPTIYCIENLQK